MENETKPVHAFGIDEKYDLESLQAVLKGLGGIEVSIEELRARSKAANATAIPE